MTPNLKNLTLSQSKYMRDVIKPAESRLQTVTVAANDAAARVASLEAALKSARNVLEVAQDQQGKAQADLDAVLPGLETA